MLKTMTKTILFTTVLIIFGNVAGLLLLGVEKLPMVTQNTILMGMLVILWSSVLKLIKSEG